MWTCINCFPDKKSVDLLLLQLFTSLYSHYLPKNKGEIYSTEKINFLSLVPTFERKITACKITSPKILPWTTMYLGFFCMFLPSSCIQDELQGIVRDNCLPACSGIPLPCSESAAGAWETTSATVRSTYVARLPSPASSGSSSCPELPLQLRLAAFTAWSWSLETLWKFPGYWDVELFSQIFER